MKTSTTRWSCTETSNILQHHLPLGRGGVVNGIGTGSGSHASLVLLAYGLVICFP